MSRSEWLCRSEISKTLGIHLAFLPVTPSLKQCFQHGNQLFGTEAFGKVRPYDLPACHRIIGFSCSLELSSVDVFVVGLEAFEVEFIRVIDAVDDVDPLRLVQVNAYDWGIVGIAVPADASIEASVDIGPISQGFGIAVQMTINLPGLDRAVAQDLVDTAHQVCPYSNATRGNIVVDLTLG
nr:hypothetical protein [uncultured Limnohabitans sp.]